MRDSVKSKLGWLALAAFLVLPNCSLQEGGLLVPSLNPGPQPWGDAIFCDIEDLSIPRVCATGGEDGLFLRHAAIDLVTGQSKTVVFDDSPAAMAAQGCTAGHPVVITLKSPFPSGVSKCLNCGAVIGSTYTDVNAACVDLCKDMNGGNSSSCTDSTKIHRASTNTSGCLTGVCVDGALPAGFVDELRVTPEPVIWTGLTGVVVTGANSNSLSKTAATTGNFDAGAASAQTITHGDGYVEFTATETNTGRICGLSTGGADSDPSQVDMGFGINLNAAGGVRIFENGVALVGPNPDTTFASYAVGDRMRVAVTDHFDGTATVTYTLIPSACVGPSCAGMVMHTTAGAAYPLRVDATFNQQGGTLTDVRLVRIK